MNVTKRDRTASDTARFTAHVPLRGGKRRILVTLALAFIIHHSSLLILPTHAAWLSDYHYRMEIVISSNAVSATLTNYPALISLTDTDLRTTSNSGHVTSSSGWDIIFTEEDGVSTLDHETELHTGTSGRYVGWVRIPKLYTTSNTVLYMYYGNTSVTESQENITNVWDSNYLGVWHLDGMADSTANANDGDTGGGTASSSSGYVGDAQLFGAGDEIKIPYSSTLQPASGLTMTVWAKPTTLNAYNTVLGYPQIDGTHTSPYFEWNIMFNSGGAVHTYINGTEAGSYSSSSINQWHCWTVSWANGGYVYYYKDGAYLGNYNTGQTVINYDNNNPVYFGRNGGDGEHWYGWLDEIRISDMTRPTAWIAACYSNMVAPTSFCKFGAETLQSGWLTGYRYRRAVTIDGGRVDGPADLTDYPMLLVTKDTVVTNSLKDHVLNANGYDIVFTKNDGTNVLDHEIELYSDAKGEFIGWIRIPTVKHTGDTLFYMYYGKTGATDQQNKTNVWDANYLGVWHLDGMADSTANANDGDSGGGSALSSGYVGDAQLFGAGDEIKIPYSSTLQPASGLTMTVWAKPTALNAYNTLLAYPQVNGTHTSPYFEWLIMLFAGGEVHTYINGTDAGSYSSSSINQWHCWTVSWANGGYVYYYKDGAYLGNYNTGQTVIDYDNNNPVYFGRNGGDTQHWYGWLDEIRISDVTRSTAWIATCHTNMADPQGFVGWGIEDTILNVDLSLSSTPISEGAVSAVVTATLSWVSTHAVTAQLRWTGTATNGQDYTRSVTDIVIPVGSTTAVSTLTLTDDSFDEYDEEVIVTLTNVVFGSLGTTTEVTLTITDDEAEPTLTFLNLPDSFGEDIGAVVVTGVLNRASEKSISAGCQTADGTATNGLDYTGVTNSLVFGWHLRTNWFSISINDDAYDEVDETLDVIFFEGANYNVAGDAITGAVTIVDNDLSPDVQFRLASSVGSENDTTPDIEAYLTRESAYVATVDYSRTGGTATSGDDFTLTPGTLTFAPGITNLFITPTVVDDSLDEWDQTIIITLSGSTHCTLGSPSTHTYTIQDEDPVSTVQLSASAYSTNEGANAAITVQVTPVSEREIWIDYATADGTAVEGSDYTGVSGTLTVPAGQTFGTFVVPLAADGMDEPDETVGITIFSAWRSVLGAQDTATMTILDVDPEPTISFAGAPGSVDEAVGSRQISAALSAESGKDVTVDYGTSDGSATAGEDYTGASGTLTWEAGETANKSFSISITNDGTEESDETVTLTLSNAANGTITGANPETLTILDDDSAATVWNYRKGLTEASAPIPDWRRVAFDDAAWLSGEAPLGYGLPGIATSLGDMQGSYSCVFLRRMFAAPNPALVRQIDLQADYNDGFLLWINGEAVARVNMAGTVGDAVAHTDLAAGAATASWSNTLTNAAIPLLFKGANVLAVQVFNEALGSTDLIIDVRVQLVEGSSLSGAVDADADGMADQWESDNIPGGDGEPDLDEDVDNALNLDEFVGGTDPDSELSVFTINVAFVDGVVLVSFPTVEAVGPNYEGQSRYYSLQEKPLQGGTFQTVPGYGAILGQGQTVVYTNAAPSLDKDYRGRVWLE